MLTPFRSSVTNPIADPFWNMDVPGLGMDVGFPNIENQLGFPNLPSVQLGMDLTEESDKWVVHADMPGFKDEDVELSIENGMLGVRGTRDKTTESDTGITHRVERSYGEVRRAIRLPRGADQDHAHAHLANGVLTIDFPKLAIENVGKKIPLLKGGK